MNFFAFTGIINAFTSIILTAVILFSGKKKITNSFLFFTSSVIIWSTAYVIWLLSSNEVSALFWVRMLMLGAIFIPFSYFHFVVLLLRIDKLKKFIIFGYFVAIIVTIFNVFDIFFHTGNFIRSVEPKLFFSFWPTPGWIFHLFLIIWFLMILYSTYLLYLSYRNSDGIIKNQIKFVFLGMVFGYSGGITNYFLWYDIPIPPIGNLFVSLYVAFVTYSIFKYRLLNFKLVITRSLIYSILVFFVAGSFVVSIAIVGEYFGGFVGTNRYIVIGVVSALVVIFLDPLKNLFAKVTDRIFFKEKIDYVAALKHLSEVLNEEIDLVPLATRFSQTLTAEFKLKEAYLVVATKKDCFSKVEDFSYNSHSHLITQTHKNRNDVFCKSALIKTLAHNKELIVTDEWERMAQDQTDENKQKRMQKVLDNMREIGAAVNVPIMDQEGAMKSILILKNKVSGDIFTQEELKLLEVLSPQIAAALEKAKLYQEAQEFNVKLKHEVEKATTELRAANDKLKQLDQAKSEFMSIASHQLRTPLTGIMGYLSMILEGDYGKIPAEQHHILKEVFDASQRLIRMVNLFLNVTRIEAGRFVMNFAKVPFANVLENIYHELLPTADKKQVKLTYKKEKLPEVEVDTDKIKDVLLNLVDNAIKYTPHGAVTLSAKAKPKTVHVMVSDTGVGIDKKDTEKLFSKFVRGSEIARVAPDGSGLGLFIAKKIVEAHGGKIWVTSEGKGRGSIFQFEIPLKADPEAKRKAEEFYNKQNKAH